MSKEKILLIDDDSSFITIISTYLEMLHYSVIKASSPDEGLKLVYKEKPDLIILDILFDGISGLDIMEDVKKVLPDIPFVITSGTEQMGDAIHALRLGAWDYFIKPIEDISLLGRSIEKCIERSILLKENAHYRKDLEQIINQRTEELRKSEQKFRSLYENSLVGMFSMHISDCKLLDANEKALTIFGYPSKEEFICSFSLLNSCADKGYETDFFTCSDRVGKPFNSEMKLTKYDGTQFWGEMTIRVYQEENTAEVIINDITHKKETEEKIFELTFYDHLTKLPNREMLKKRLSSEIMRNRRFAVMCIGLDKFKNINDMYGPIFGDRLLYEIGSNLDKNFFSKDLVAHFGGDKFIVLLSGLGGTDDAMDIENIKKIVDKTHDIFLQPFNIEGEIINITPSIGICLYPSDGRDPDTLIKNSEIALYIAKEKGRNRSMFYDAKLNEEIMHRLNMEKELRYAIENNEFIAYYQPKVNSTGKFIGMESLIRWKSSNKNRMIMPLEFIPLAEQNGMIVEIGYYMIRKACMQNKKWQDMGLPTVPVSVNLSPYQFSQPDLITKIQEMIAETGLEPQWLELEITESGIMLNESENIEKLQKIHEMGIGISIDDFGTGYSSLSKLKDYPIDTLKIDKSFVDDLPGNKTSATIATTIIDLAHNLGFNVVAEGVETREQLDFLIKNGCDQFQGYYFFKPLPSDDLEKNFKAQN